MKTLLKTLSVLTLATSTGNLSSFLSTNLNYNLNLNNKIEISEDIEVLTLLMRVLHALKF